MITAELLKSCYREFESYFQSLSVNAPEIHHKVEDIRTHSLRVAANMKEISKLVLQTEEEQRIAEVAGLFHDLGKADMFVQGTESPSTIQRDHAEHSGKMLKTMKFLQSLTEEIQLVLVKAVESHNKAKLPKLDNEQQATFARLLRDADKLDIFESSYRFFKEKYGVQPLMTYDLVNYPEYSEKILKNMQQAKIGLIEDMKTMNDYKLLLLSMAYDLNYKYTFRLLSERQYIQKIYETLPKRDQIIDAYRSLKLFVENKFVS